MSRAGKARGPRATRVKKPPRRPHVTLKAAVTLDGRTTRRPSRLNRVMRASARHIPRCASATPGPSGRNGGFCNVMWFSLPNMRERWGDEGALAVARAAEQAAVGVGEFCEQEGVDAWYTPGGYLQVSTAEAHDGVWADALDACRELGATDAIQPLSAEQVAERCASPAFRGGSS